VTRTRKIWIAIIAVVVVLATATAIAFPFIKRKFFAPTPSNIPSGQSVNNASNIANVLNVVHPANETHEPTSTGQAVETVQQGLDIPWELAFILEGHLFITERAGQLLHIGDDRTAIPVEGVKHQGEGGLLGMALDPDFADNLQVYLYMTTAAGGGLTNRVERYTFDGVRLNDRTVIIENIPGASNHDGGRIAFGPDGKLYIGTGDAGDPSNSQDKTSLAGKILRLNRDGSIPSDNPFDNEVWSMGHRNVQGLAWDDQGRLWATEHGPSGVCPECGQDELNLIEKGKNYGWPDVRGDATAAGIVSPIVHSGVGDTWAPSGIAFYKAPGSKNGSLFFAGLRGEALYEAKITGDRTVELVAHFKSDFGRLRTVSLGPDNMLYVLTNNTDGRGSPKNGDDKLLKIDPTKL